MDVDTFPAPALRYHERHQQDGGAGRDSAEEGQPGRCCRGHSEGSGPPRSPLAVPWRASSNDAENKRYTGDTIEHVTDTFGANDPNYKDTENNVVSLAKGILGFIGDVGLDPLTYIPGAQIAKVGNIVGQGAKGALRGAGWCRRRRHGGHARWQGG